MCCLHRFNLKIDISSAYSAYSIINIHSVDLKSKSRTVKIFSFDVIINIDICNLPAGLFLLIIEVDEFCNGDVTSLVTEIDNR